MNIYIYIIICIKLEAVHSTSKDILISKFHGNQKTNASCYTKIKSSHLILWISDDSSVSLQSQIGWYIYMRTISLSAPYNKYQDELFFCELQRNEQNHNTLDYSGDGEKWLVCNVKTPNRSIHTYGDYRPVSVFANCESEIQVCQPINFSFGVFEWIRFVLVLWIHKT